MQLISQPLWIIKLPHVCWMPHRISKLYHCHQIHPYSSTIFPQGATSDSLSYSCVYREQQLNVCLMVKNESHAYTHNIVYIIVILFMITTMPLCVWFYLQNDWSLVCLTTEQLSTQISAELCYSMPHLTVTHARSSLLWQAHTWYELDLHHSVHCLNYSMNKFNT